MLNISEERNKESVIDTVLLALNGAAAAADAAAAAAAAAGAGHPEAAAAHISNEL